MVLDLIYIKYFNDIFGVDNLVNLASIAVLFALFAAIYKITK